MRLSLLATATLLAPTAAPAADPPALKVLFLGDSGHHLPAARFRQLRPVFAARNIALTYTETLSDLNPDTLGKYDGLMIFANHTDWAPENEKALLDYVASGKGFIPLHCASYCFIKSQPYIDLVGAQFRSHTTGVFRVENAAPDHPVMAGFTSFESWDETYTHYKHNENDRTVLEYRTDRMVKEPWTWVRTHGMGRVFYTAWGHDHRTWSHPGFHNLVERGTRWACGQDPALAGPSVDAPKMAAVTGDPKDFESVPAKVPFYPAGEKWGTVGEPIATMQKPLPPEKSVKHYTHPEGFELKLFAADDQFAGGKPIAMTWDERGRLWAAVTVDYPNELQREGQGRDKIVILEDTDADGKADRTTVFADKLSIPTSLLCVHGGVVVTQAPHTLFLKDTDGDDKVDVRQVLFTGWGTRDTHAGPSSLRYGFDNWVYGMCGYSGFDGTLAGERVRFGQGLWRMKLDRDADDMNKPTASKLEFLRSTNNNSWGVGFSEDGQLFGSTANNCPMVHLAVPNRYYEKVRGLNPGPLPMIALDNRYHPVTEKVRQVDWHGGFTSAAGCSLYTARVYPKEYWNRTAFVSDPTGHLTATFVLQPAGADYVARYGWNLVASQDEWASPIDAQVGPDGNVWVLDWYNFIVQHNPTPKGFTTGKGNAYETDLRDKEHGRVYRLVHTRGTPEPKVNLKGATPDKLVETLKHPNMLWRMHAQRLLVERGKGDVVPALGELAADTAAPETAAVHAIHAVAALRPNADVSAALKAASAAVRRAAVQTLPRSAESALALANANLLTDTDPSVRLAALLALADMPSQPAVGPLLAVELSHLSPVTEKAIADAAVVAAAAQADGVLKFAAAVREPWSKEGLAALERVAASYAVRPANGDAPTVGTILQRLPAGPAGEAVVAGLLAGWPANKPANLSADDEKAFGQLVAKLPASGRGRLLKLGSVWGVKGLEAQLAEIATGLLQVVADDKATDEARLDAAKQVIEFRPEDDAAAAKLLDAATSRASPKLVAGVFEALSGSQAKNLGPAVIARLGTLPPTARPAALRLVVARPEPARAFLDAVEAGKLRFDMLALDQRTALAVHPDAAIADRAKKLLALGGGLPDPNRQKVIDELSHVLKAGGDVANGKKQFATHCAKCHKHGTEGTTIGPDLTGFGTHPKEEILIHVLDPSRSVEGNFKTYTATLLDGRVVTGLLSAETKTTVELLDAENKKHTLNRDDVEEFKESAKSLMPEGFEKQMKSAELADLLAFLTQKGKFVPLPLDRAATVVSTKDMFFGTDGPGGRMAFPDWGPKTFNGVPFALVDPQGDKVKNVILLNGPNGVVPPKMPKSVTVPVNAKAKAVHLLSGVGGWNALSPGRQRTVSMIVRLHYADGTTEDHPLRDGEHFADYIRRVDVPGSQFAFDLRGAQVRYLAVTPKRADAEVRQIEFMKGPDRTAPVVMAATVETP